MFIVKIYVLRERKRSAPVRKILRRDVVTAREAKAIIEEYGDDPNYIVTAITAYRGAK